MEEEVGIKVTRLRRRLSVEADDVKSPSTPTKKRGGRLAAKPQLELIDENAPEAAPKRIRTKSSAKDLADPEEKAVTPSRRSTRIRSNTSIVSETPSDAPEDKGTPSRRSTRIKSNTSLISETVNVNSPRAKRAARRTSQVGSDNEAPITPARQTRRTRKDSTSSIDKPVEHIPGKLGSEINEVIVEESETNVKEAKKAERLNNESPTLRKSPRLNRKSGRKSSLDNEKGKETKNDTETSEITTTTADKSQADPKVDQTNETVNQKTSEQSNISWTSKKLIVELEELPKKITDNLNKSTTAVENVQIKSKRNRTKSWTTISVEPSHEKNFCSDSEASKKMNKKKNDTLNLSNISGSGDGIMNMSNNKDDEENVSLNSSTQSSKKKKKKHEMSTSDETTPNMNEVLNTSSIKSTEKISEAKEDSKKIDDKVDSLNSSKTHDTGITDKIFEQAPSATIQSLVFIEDSDSNPGSIGKDNTDKGFDSGDQCVPVVAHLGQDVTTKDPRSNLSYEPMDIDETMPENVSLSNFVDKNDSLSYKEKGSPSVNRKSLLNNSQVQNDTVNKSNRKSILSNNALDDTISQESNKTPKKAFILENIGNDQESKDLNTSKSKRKSSISQVNAEDTTDGIHNVSNRKSLVVNTNDDSFNKKLNKSKTKSSVSNDVTEVISENDMANDESFHKSSNKSKRKSSISNIVSDENTNEDLNKPKRKSSISGNNDDDGLINKSSNKSTRKSAGTDQANESLLDKSLNKSQRKNSVSASKDDDELINKSNNKSTIKSAGTDQANESCDKNLNKSQSKSSVSATNDDDELMNKSNNKSTRKSSMGDQANGDNVDEDLDRSKRISSVHVLNADSMNEMKISISEPENVDESINKRSNKSIRKSSVFDQANSDNIDKSLNKSKRKSVSTENTEVSSDKMKTSMSEPGEDTGLINKSFNKSKRKLSTSNIVNDDSINIKSDKSGNKSLGLDNENKSTLVLSQLKDISENEISVEANAPKELSKSVNVPNVNTETESDKKNLSLTYSTSTPLQQKSMKKLGLQINSSIIAPNSANKMENKGSLNKSKKEESIMSEEGSDYSEDENSKEDGSEQGSDEESSLKKSKLIDDEAEEASDDYESGDSRDEDEREYEEQNEIVEKGETLDSEEDEYTDDSEYERDSFIVSSDEEDNELLSGSGDDLSMSANELTMSSKSKKKFNERKIKEQKKASKEMFEARHKLNESDKSNKSAKTKVKKNNRQQLNSSSSDSEEEVDVPLKKKGRLRIDSSQDISGLQSDADKSKSKKKKIKRLSENDTNEREITVCEETTADKDPLTLVNVFKEEPKTPQKELNISTVAVTTIDEVEEVNVDENVSIMKSNKTADPLQATMSENDTEDDDDGDSISENEEIAQNYESVLNNLNKSNSKKKIKSVDISLDLNKKTKQKSKEPIVDQLNLTQVKKNKKKQEATSEKPAETKKIDKSLSKKTTDDVKQDTFSEGSSDSIDMKLLFPEDSNDSEIVTKTQVVKETAPTTQETPEEFIPLKKSEGKTNILENIDIANKSKDESILNVSGKKKNKRKSVPTEKASAMSAQDDDLGFFIDTTGTLADGHKADANTSIKNSAKKNKQKNNVSFVIEETVDDDNSNDAPLEISYRSDKNKSKQNLSMIQENKRAPVDDTAVETPNQSAKKKKTNKGLNSSQNVGDISIIEYEDNVAEKPVNVSVANVNGSANKKKKRLSESQVDNETVTETPAETIVNIYSGSAKKGKKNVISESTTIETDNVNKGSENVINQDQNTKKRKRKPSANQTIDEIIIKDDKNLMKDESFKTNNQKKKRKISDNVEDIKAQVEDPVTEIQEKEKIKKKGKILSCENVDEISEKTAKKNKKRKERDDDDASKISKVLKQNSFDKVHVPRLPTNVLKQLHDKPNKDDIEAKKKVISTSSFVVEETKTRRNKPSNYLEESVYCMNDDDVEEKKQKRSIKNPKVLPFIPTASTSDRGFTTNFKVNVISQPTQFVAQSNDISNFKNDYLHKKRIKKLGTFEMYKRQRNIKISKF